MPSHILVIDQGTTSTRAIVFDAALEPVATAQEEFPQIFPAPGWVEHDPEALWATTLRTARDALARSGIEAGGIAGLGITNQRETVVIWERDTGRAIANAIVWQDRRTADLCDRLVAEGHDPEIMARTGLRLDPYFSATKIAWLLDEVPGARAAAEAGRLAFGTVDTFLLWRLTDGKVHATEATNASRTMLCDIHTGQWDEDLLALFRIPASLLPEIRDSSGTFGDCAPHHFGAEIPIRGIAGDQQAALIGQGCFAPGTVKATYGTGGFVLLNIGAEPKPSQHRLLTTIAWQRGGKRLYALEGSIFSAGASVQWLRDGLGLVENAADTGRLAAASDPAQPVYLVPAFTGLGAPHWNARATTLITGITRGTTAKELARAVLESVGYQTLDLLQAMLADYGAPIEDLVFRVDGGLSASDWAMQFTADMLGHAVERPDFQETTALGAAYLAGLDAGLCSEPAAFARRRPASHRFLPALDEDTRRHKHAGWLHAVRLAVTPPEIGGA